MSHRSSISNSRTLVSFPKPTKAFLLGLVLVAAVRVVIGMNSERLNYFRSNTRDSSFMYIEHFLIGGLKKPPRVVLLGSSRMRYGLLEDVFAETSGISRDEIINAGTSSGTPLDMMWMLKRNPILLEGADLIIMDFNRQMYNQQPLRPLFYRFASINDRIMFDRMKDKAEGLADFVFRNYAEKRKINDWLNGLTGKTGRKDILTDYADRGMWKKLLGREVPDHLKPKGAAKGYMGDFAESRMMVRAMNWIAETCQEKNIQLVLLQTPTSSAYKNEIAKVPGGREGNEKYFEWLNSYCPPAIFLNQDVPESLGLSDANLVDYGHLDEASAEEMTRIVVKILKQKGLLPKE